MNSYRRLTLALLPPAILPHAAAGEFAQRHAEQNADPFAID